MFFDFDYRGTFAIIRRSHPGLQHTALVGGHAAEDLRNLRLARRAAQDEFGQIDVVDPMGRTPREITGGLGKRRDRPMLTLNGAALPPSLFEAELFGREKDAFTGALSREAGRFELADGSPNFLEEIGDLNPDVQTKLLRVLEHGELQRVGGTQAIKVDVRMIAATNPDLPAAVQAGTFREDLFYGPNVFPISVPPLRERKDDIPLLAWVFAKQFGQALGKPVERITQDTMEALQRYP